MMLHVRLHSPGAPPRDMEFQRERIVLGASSRADISTLPDVPSLIVAEVIADLEHSGIRLNNLNVRTEVRVALPNGQVVPARGDVIYPIGSSVLPGPDDRFRIEVVSLAARQRPRVSAVLQAISVEQACAADALVPVLQAIAMATEPEPVLNALLTALRAEAPVVALRWVYPTHDPRELMHATAGDRALTEDVLHRVTDSIVPGIPASTEPMAFDDRFGDGIVCPMPLPDGRRAFLIARIDGSPALTVERTTALRKALWPALTHFVERLIQQQHALTTSEENRYFRERERRHYAYRALVAHSPAMRAVQRALQPLTTNDAPVLLSGEAGTGKELLVRALHHLGPRAPHMLVAQHCGALDEDALDAELFGVVRVMPDGRTVVRRGILELCDGGTVFLDEVHLLSDRLQLKLVRLLTEREVMRIGDPDGRSVQVRLIVASHLNLMALADEGRFRPDLAIPLQRNAIRVPALRERPEDLPELAQTFTHEFARRYRRHLEGVHPDALAWMSEQAWPGNVRELMTVIERAVLRCSDEDRWLSRAHFAD